MKAECRVEFTTREQIMKPLKRVVKPGEHGRLCARTRVALTAAPADGLAAAQALGLGTLRSAGPGDARPAQRVCSSQQAGGAA